MKLNDLPKEFVSKILIEPDCTIDDDASGTRYWTNKVKGCITVKGRESYKYFDVIKTDNWKDEKEEYINRIKMCPLFLLRSAVEHNNILFIYVSEKEVRCPFYLKKLDKNIYGKIALEIHR